MGKSNEGLPGGDAYVKDLPVGGHVPLVGPAQELVHHVRVVHVLCQALHQAQGHRGIVRPGSGGLVMGSIGPHPVYGIAFQFLP